MVWLLWKMLGGLQLAPTEMFWTCGLAQGRRVGGRWLSVCAVRGCWPRAIWGTEGVVCLGLPLAAGDGIDRGQCEKSTLIFRAVAGKRGGRFSSHD